MAYAAPEPYQHVVPEIRYFFEDSTGVGDDSETLRRSSRQSLEHFLATYLRSWGNTFIRFLQLKVTWEKETAHLSSLISMHPAYQQIIGMGPTAIPFILRELKNKPGHWFWALKSITGEDPVLPEHRGKIKQMTDDWLKWAKEQEYI